MIAKSAAKKRAEKLSGQRELFARSYVRIGSATRAYRMAFNVGPRTKPETVWSAASRLLADDKVAARISAIRLDAAKRAGVTVESLIVGLETNLELARELDNPSAANQAIMGQGKLAGFLKDKLELGGKDGAAIQVQTELSADERSVNDIARRIAFALAKGKRRAGAAKEKPEA